MEEDKHYKKAFPISNEYQVFDTGMSLRDYFAAKAMQSLITIQLGNWGEDGSKQAYYIADEMLKQRENP